MHPDGKRPALAAALQCTPVGSATYSRPSILPAAHDLQHRPRHRDRRRRPGGRASRCTGRDLRRVRREREHRGYRQCDAHLADPERAAHHGRPGSRRARRGRAPQPHGRGRHRRGRRRRSQGRIAAAQHRTHPRVARPGWRPVRRSAHRGRTRQPAGRWRNPRASRRSAHPPCGGRSVRRARIDW